MKYIGFAAAGIALAAAAGGAVPSVSGVTIAQDASTRAVTVTYTLSGAPAIITLDILTNGVSIGQSNIWALEGDVDRLVQNGVETTAAVTAWAENDPPMYLAADLVSGGITYHTCAEAVPGGATNILYKTTSILMRRIYAKDVTWVQGAPSDEPGYGGKREKQRESTFKNDYYIGVYPVTQQQWYQVHGDWPSYYAEANARATRPVEQVSMTTIRDGGKAENDYPGDPAEGSFLGLLRARTGVAFDIAGFGQWEYACRAGHGPGFWGDGSPILSTLTTNDGTTVDPNLSRLARYAATGGNGAGVFDGAAIPAASATAEYATAPVGSYAPNSWGLYDMHGNVWEIVLDVSQFEDGWLADPSTINSNYGVSLDGSVTAKWCSRGSCFQRGPYRCRASFYAAGPGDRTTATKTTGFRLAVTLP